MSQANIPPSPDLQEQVRHLHHQLQLRDQLVKQLSEELYRLIRDQPGLTQQSETAQPMQSLPRQLQVVKQQLAHLREDIAKRNAEIAHLRQSLEELSVRNSLLEQAMQELPEVYRQRFSERIRPVRQRLMMLQQENHQLQARLQNANYGPTIRTPYPKLEVPNFSRPTRCSDADNFSHPSGVERTSSGD